MDLQEVGWAYALDGSGSVYGQVAGACECGNGPLGSMKREEFLDCQRNCGFSRRAMLRGAIWLVSQLIDYVK